MDLLKGGVGFHAPARIVFQAGAGVGVYVVESFLPSGARKRVSSPKVSHAAGELADFRGVTKGFADAFGLKVVELARRHFRGMTDETEWHVNVGEFGTGEV